jgi:hypothetical protein
MDNYKYTLEKLVQHLIALEEHLRDNQCSDCIFKHGMALKLYIDEAISLCSEVDQKYFKALRTRFEAWFSKLNSAKEEINADQIRDLRKEIVNKFLLSDFERQYKSKKGCCK